MPKDSLVRLAQAGDPDAFAALYAKHKPRVYSQVFRMVKNDAKTEDLIQEIFFHVWKKLKQFRGQSTFGTWLYRIARNFVLMRFRDAQASTRIPEGLLEEYAETYEDTRVTSPYTGPRRTDSDLHIDLVRSLAKLPKGYRQAVLAHHVYGATHEEIAKTMGWRTGTSKSQTSKAVGMLRGMLA